MSKSFPVRYHEIKHKTIPPKYIIAFNTLKLKRAATTRKQTKNIGYKEPSNSNTFEKV